MSVALAHGDIVANRYRLLAPLGQGGMGVVWRAEHLVLGRPVAVKFGTRGHSHDLRRAQRFLAEAKAAATVRHPNVVDILDFGVSDAGQPYMVMELLEGMSLRERLAASPPLSIGLLLDYVDSVLAGLAAVHGVGLVHRDLKPENVFLAEQPSGVVPKLLDFGLTRSVDIERASHDAVTLTQEDQLLGTPAFMAPEQIRQVEDLDARVDVWGVGVLLYASLTGRLPFDAPKVVDLLFEISRGADPPSVVSVRPEIGRVLSDVVGRAIARDRSERYATVDALRVALRDARGASAEVLSAPARALPAPRRAPDGAWLSRDAVGSTDGPLPEILTLPGDPRVDSTIRERAQPPRNRWRQWMIVTLILVVGIMMSAWLVAELLIGSNRPPSRTTRSLAEDAPAPVEPAAADAVEAPSTPPSASPRPRKSSSAKPRPGAGGSGIIREPDY